MGRGYMPALSSLHLATPVTGQLADTPTRGLPTRGLDISRTGQLADKTSRGLGNSRMPPATLCAYLSFFWPFIETASCPVREMSSLRVGSPRVSVSVSCPVTATPVSYGI